MSERDDDSGFEDYARSLFTQVDAPGRLDRWRHGVPAAHPGSRGRRLVAMLAAAVLVVVTISGITIGRRLLHPPAPPSPAVSTTEAPRETSSTRPSANPTPAPSSRPSARGWPDAGDTGVPRHVSLREHPGDLRVRKPGQVVDGLRVTGSVFVEAANVTLRNMKIVPGDGALFGIRQQPGARGLVIEDTEIVGGAEYAVRQEASGLSVRRARIHGADVGLVLAERASVTDSYIHDVNSMGIYHAGGAPHVLIEHNTILNPSAANATISLYTDSGPQTDVLIQDNLLDGGNYTLAAGAGSGSHHIRVIRNRFRDHGKYGPAVAFDKDAPGNLWQDNTWVATEKQISPP
ncbi:MAG TPA: right-handed parallel beta-helix repeat-containing protein [Nonomuraea sp.]|nr:right-handed parallel beta-helix repeat-containing protein [Nonomuraea sp.]